MIDTPQFQLPFRFVGNRVVEIEEDSIEEVTQCVYAVLVYHRGQLIFNPAFGIPEQLFRERGANLSELRRSIEELEPRVTALVQEGTWDLAGLAETVGIRVSNLLEQE